MDIVSNKANQYRREGHRSNIKSITTRRACLTIPILTSTQSSKKKCYPFREAIITALSKLSPRKKCYSFREAVISAFIAPQLKFTFNTT